MAEDPLAALDHEERQALAQLAQAQADGSMTRRQWLKLGAALGVGGLVGGGGAAALTGDAEAADTGTGVVGEPGNPQDVYLDRLLDDGGDAVLDIDDTGAIAGQNGRTWDFPAVNTEQLSTVRFISPNDDFQARLDEVTRRAAEYKLENDTYSQSSTILVGQHTTLLGGNADLVSQGSTDYNPFPIVEFTADVDGFETDPNVTYRVHHPMWEDITIVGTGAGNTSAAVRLSNNADGEDVGFAEFDNCFFEQYNIAVDGQGNADGARFRNCHVQYCQRGFVDLGVEAWIDRCTFFNMSGDALCVEVTGSRGSWVTNSEFEASNSQTTYIKAASPRNVISGCQFKTDYSDAVLATFPYQKITGCNFSGGVANSYLDLRSTYNVVAHNTWGDVTTDSSIPVMKLTGNADYNVIVGNQFPTSGFSTTINIASGATENIIWGRIPQGVDDSGTRTVINGVGQNSGDPSAGSGDWAGFSDTAYHMGAVIKDTTGSDYYRPLPPSATNDWIRLSGTAV